MGNVKGTIVSNVTRCKENIVEKEKKIDRERAYMARVTKPMELNLLLDENYNKLQEHLIMGYKKLYKIRELYFGETEKQPLEASPICTKVDMIITTFNDMHNFINTTEEFLDLL